MSSYQDRFEEEVNRIGVTAIANQLGVARNTIYNWMAKANTPMNYLVALHSGLGMDISYVLFNERARSSDTAIHQAVLDAVDLLSLDKKVDGVQLAKAVVKLCAKNSVAPTPSVSLQPNQFEGSMQVFHQAPGGDIAGRDIVKKMRK